MAPYSNFTPPATQPLVSLVEEPDGDEAAASFARLQASLAMPVPGDEQASRAASLLDELQAAGEAQRPPASGTEGPAKTGDELG